MFQQMMNQAMASLSRPPTIVTSAIHHQVQLRSLVLWKASSPLRGVTFPHVHLKHSPVLCSKLTPWEPSPITYVPTEDSDGSFLKGSGNIFESMNAEETVESSVLSNEDATGEQPSLQPLKWPMWLLGPLSLLITGMVPTLWLPLSSVFLGANIAGLLSLVGLDCIFNIGATLFLLMADACARPKSLTQACKSRAPISYRFWNMAANVMGIIIPLTMLFASHKGFLQPQLSFISFAVLLGPYLLLLSIQILTEILVWHWQSSVWLVTPVVYEAYRVLQLMRGLRLSADIGAPIWIVETIRALVSWWVLILGMQLMRVAWFAGFTARAHRKT